ncbi:type VI secretion protein [Pseudomonas sp. PB120]|uniref:type VI secretion system Vgr family protein n=1 Tax=Pseudomonas sp. PB120 TaxID=2494700 RepID=UPI0012FDE698|nr:contractile injection system protein, VgrG/Pvc8 family [Pseudomonas sp. PB120]MVV49225.1 type VI secretion protein [Pseudomonas sp. PB120]
MFDSVNEPAFRLDVAGQPDTFEVLAFTGREAISEPCVFDVDLLIDDPVLDLASLLYRPAFLRFGPADNGIHGVLHELVLREHGAGARLCRARLGPKLTCLGQRFSQRMFSARSVPDILNQMLVEHGIVGRHRRFELSGDYPPRDFCTQYRESDLHFLQRLCADHRLHYHFEHDARGHCLVFGDGQAHFQAGENAVFDVEREHPAVRQFELLSAPATALYAEGCSDLPMLRSGQYMPLSGHPAAECNRRWLLTHVEHEGAEGEYSNRFRGIQHASPVVFSQSARKPRMHGLQRAWVVDVDEAQPDPSRPVAVQFDWLYQGDGATPSHCWLPLAAELGAANVSQLSEGTEVVVSFVDGDPDQPLITGFLHVPAPAGVAHLPQRAADCPSVDGLLGLLRSGEPLTLLCLLPGGGSFSHCAQAVCTCRVATRLSQSGAA